MTQPTSLADGRYLLVEQLGEGGMATVYRAFDQRLQVWRAVKILSPDYADKPKIARRFEAEAQTMALLEHPHIVRVYDVGRDGKHTAYIVMELVEGGCLVDWLEHHGPMPPAMAVRATIEVCDGLGAAHAKGVIHRDIKPHNVMVTGDGMCRVTDFGIARVGDSETSQTKTGSVMGTWGYMAPEQRTNAKGVDVRSDVYAVGATLYSLVTDRMPMDLFAAERDSSILEGVHEELVPLLVKSTEYSREDRYDDVAALRAALVEVLEKLPADPDGTPPLALELGESPAPPDPTQYQTRAEGPPPDSAGATILPGEGGAHTDPAPTILPDGDAASDTPAPAGARQHAMTMPPEEVAVTQPGALSRQSRPVFQPDAVENGPAETGDTATAAPIHGRTAEPAPTATTGKVALFGGGAMLALAGVVLLIGLSLAGWAYTRDRPVVPDPTPIGVQPEQPDPTQPDPTQPDPTQPASPDPTQPVPPGPAQPEPAVPGPAQPDPVAPTPPNPVQPTANPTQPVVPDPSPVQPVGPALVDPAPPTVPDPAPTGPPCAKPVAKVNSSGNKVLFRLTPCGATALADHTPRVHYRAKGESSYRTRKLTALQGFWTIGVEMQESFAPGVEYYIDGWGSSAGSAGSPKTFKP